MPLNRSLETDVTTDTDPRDQEFVMPCCEAVLAGTLALMTGHAQATCPVQRTQMARRIASNLAMLVHARGPSASFGVVARRLQTAWTALATGPLLH